jgi:hemoglobin
MKYNLARRILPKTFPLLTKHNEGKTMNTKMHTGKPNEETAWIRHTLAIMTVAMVLALTGCGGGGKAQQKNTDFFTSGSREADQRASQRMAKEEQLSGTGEGAGEKNAKKAETSSSNTNLFVNGTNRAAQVEGKLSLFDRLGGEAGISNIVADFTPRALQDPRVNWDRKGVKQGGLLRGGKSETWVENPQSVEVLRAHMVQFLILATGGPAHYEGKEIKSTHAGMHISNPEFDAVMGDFKASLDKLRIPNKEQKELLSIVESTRPLIVTER